MQACHENKNTNEMKECTTDVMFLKPNDNLQGGHAVMNLSTGQRVARPKATPIPLPLSVENRVEDMALEQGTTHLKFTNEHGTESPNVDEIAGVDCEEEICEQENDEDKDPTCEPPQ